MILKNLIDKYKTQILIKSSSKQVGTKIYEYILNVSSLSFIKPTAEWPSGVGNVICSQ